MVDLRRQIEEVELPAEQHEPDVDALPPLDPRHDAQERVGEGARRGVRLGHVPPLRRTLAAPRAACAGRSAMSCRLRSGSSPSQPAGTSATDSSTAADARAASRSSASAIGPADGSRTWSASTGTGSCAVSDSGRSPCRRKNAAPWSISHVRPCQRAGSGCDGCGRRWSRGCRTRRRRRRSRGRRCPPAGA